MAISLSYPSQLGTEITSLGATDWLVGETAAGVVGKLRRQALSNIAVEWSASKVYLPSNGAIGYWNGSSWASRLTFSSGTAEFYCAAMEVNNVAGTALAPVSGQRFALPSGNYIGDASMGGYSNLFVISSGGAARVGVGPYGDWVPVSDNSYQCGASNWSWSDVWCYTLNEISDERLKTAVADSDLGLDFILSLRPVKYRWVVGRNVVTPGEKPGDPPVQTSRPGVRMHYGLLAQQVKAALGDRDFGGHVLDAETGQHALRYSQFIAPLIKALQEEHAARLALEDRVAGLELRLTALETKQPGGGSR